MVRHLQPLAVAANITQAAFCRLDEVLMTFGHLVLQYTEMAKADTEDNVACTAIIKSIETRWSKADQEVFIAAVVVNPFYQNTPFAPLRQLTLHGIQMMLYRLWLRFYKTEPPELLSEQVKEYLTETGLFSDLKTIRGMAQIAAERKVNTHIT